MKPTIFDNETILTLLENQKTTMRCDPFIFKLKDGNDHDKNTEIYSLGEYYTGHIETGACLYKRNKRQVWSVVSDRVKPKYRIADTLWVRESFGLQTHHGGEFLVYKADNPLLKNCDVGPNGSYKTHDVKWNSPSRMTKTRARIFLQITDIRVEKLHDLTPEQALQDIICPITENNPEQRNPLVETQAKWDNPIGKNKHLQYPWYTNPWIWVYSFKQLNSFDRKC